MHREQRLHTTLNPGSRLVSGIQRRFRTSKKPAAHFMSWKSRYASGTIQRMVTNKNAIETVRGAEPRSRKPRCPLNCTLSCIVSRALTWESSAFD